MSAPTQNTRPSIYQSLSSGTRGIIEGIAAALVAAALIAIFITDGAAVGFICTVIVLLIVIAVKVSRIAKTR